MEVERMLRALLLAIWAGLCTWDRFGPHLGSRKPLLASVGIGIILGDMKTAIMIRVTMELMWLGVNNIGAYVQPDVISGTIVGADLGIGSFVIEDIVNFLQNQVPWVLSGFSTAVGLAMLLDMMMKKNMRISLLLGFIMAAFLNVPTVGIALPGGGRATGKSESLVELMGLMPTLFDLCGLSIPEGVEGPSLAQELAGAEKLDRAYLHDEQSRDRDQSNQRIVTERDKYLWFTQTGVEQYFNLDEDPRETRGLIDDPACAEHIAELRGLLIDELEDREEGYAEDGKLVVGRTPVKVLERPRSAHRWVGHPVKGHVAPPLSVRGAGRWGGVSLWFCQPWRHPFFSMVHRGAGRPHVRRVVRDAA